MYFIVNYYTISILHSDSAGKPIVFQQRQLLLVPCLVHSLPVWTILLVDLRKMWLPDKLIVIYTAIYICCYHSSIAVNVENVIWSVNAGGEKHVDSNGIR